MGLRVAKAPARLKAYSKRIAKKSRFPNFARIARQNSPTFECPAAQEKSNPAKTSSSVRASDSGRPSSNRHLKIAPGLYQYTAVDDCTRIRSLALFDRRTAANSLTFLEQMIEEMPFPIQRIQTDRGREFFVYKFQERLKEYAIKFRPIKPRSPHLNGKVERSQRTDLEEFYPTVDLKDPELKKKLQDWQDYYNEFRPHGSLNGKTP